MEGQSHVLGGDNEGEILRLMCAPEKSEWLKALPVAP